MHNQDFVHLHVHSEYSLLDGLGSPEQYAERAVELGFPALAVTDHGNIDGHLKWQRACKKTEIKPIFGCEIYLVEDMKKKEKGDQKWHMTVLAKNFEGWKVLAKMLTIANLEGFYGKPRIDRKVFLENVNDGLVVLTGCSFSFLLMPGGQDLLVELAKNRGIECYLEVMPHRIDGQVKINGLCLELGKKYGISLVATNDCHYIRTEHAKAQEVLLAIQRQAKWSNPDRWRFGFEGLHLRTADEMISEFKIQGVLNREQRHKAVMNALTVGEKCWGFRIPKREISLPVTRYEKKQSELNAGEILDWLSRDRRALMVSQKTWSSDYSDRYNREMNIIERKSFARYFLIVHEIIQWCKEKEIMVGPGRGSVGGSLVAYLLGMTQVDPLKYGLLFERFISEDRIDYPDIDLDFEDIKCDQVRKHLIEEYGEFNVSGISTFLSMKGRGVVRDVGRVFELPTGDVDSFAKAIWVGDEEDIVSQAAEKTKEGQDFARKYPEELRLACVLAGQIRGAGQHPAGLIISGKDLRGGESGNICRRSDVLVCNWDMDDCEYNGLIKIDVLKLGTLTVLNEAKRLLELKGIGVNYDEMTFDDSKIFQMLSEGNTSGVFQFSGYTLTELCKKMGVVSFDDMVVIVALGRPGPAESGMTDLYIRRKKGEKWNPIHPIYEEISRDTYGVMPYQEQIMKAMTDLAGFSNSDADRIRKVIGKKRKAEEFEPYREAFLKGCREKRTLNEKQANEFWQGLLEFAHYAFNKSHSVEYAMIGYYTAFIKLYHPTEFFCAQLIYGSDKESMVNEAELAGLQIVTPKVGLSDARRWISRDGRLYMPFVEIKGIGDTQADKCAAMRFPKSGMKGFFELREERPKEAKGKLEKLLAEVMAFNPDPSVGPENPLDYFQYSIKGGNTDEKIGVEIIKKRMHLDPEVLKCVACGLRRQASRVVSSSFGMYNVLVLAEAPGNEEDEEGRGLVGDAGRLFWAEMAAHRITRRMVHVGNCCKCWPSRTKTPSKDEINECFGLWMAKEILSMNCRLILATGNVPLYALTGRDSGITAMSGQMEWVEKMKAWVVWCIHPSAVLRNRRTNLEPFQKGIEKFAEVFNGRIGG